MAKVVTGNKNAYKCRYIYSPLTSLSRNSHLFCTWHCKMIYKQRRITAFPERKYFTMDSSARSHWRNKIFTKKTSVLFPILPGHNSPPFLCSQNRFRTFCTNGTAKSGDTLSQNNTALDTSPCAAHQFIHFHPILQWGKGYKMYCYELINKLYLNCLTQSLLHYWLQGSASKGHHQPNVYKKLQCRYI